MLEGCQENNIKLFCHKLEASPKVDFNWNHIWGPQGYCPTEVRIDDIINLPAPVHITELRLFIGFWNQMRNYLPDFNHSLDNIRKLLKKDTPYIWDESMYKEFKKNKINPKIPIWNKAL